MVPARVWLCRLLLLAPGVNAQAGTIHVPGDAPTIQAGIELARSGDCIQVQAGTYMENVDFGGKSIEVRSVDGAAVTVIDGRSKPRATVSFISGEGPSARLVGFTVRRGQPGILCAAASPTIAACRIEDNAFAGSGGGVQLLDSSAVLQGCTIAGNDAFEGGGVAVRGTGRVTISGCVFRANAAASGGGVIFNETHFRLEECTLYDNVAAFVGGGIAVIESVGTIVRSRIEDNHAGGYGGGLYLVGDTDVEGCEVFGNRSAKTGGGVVIHADTRLNRCSFWKNTASNYGGGIYCAGGSTEIRHCTVHLNEAEHGNGLTTSEFATGPTDVTVSNSIFWNNGTPHYNVTIDPATTVTIRYSNVEGGVGDVGIISADPRFVNPDAGDFHLRSDSPCIDAGDPASPPDPDGSIADLGAFVFEVNEFLRGDVDGDGDVDAVPDALFLLAWGFLEGPHPACLDAADVNDDGELDTLLDTFALLGWAFANDPPPPDPGPHVCGPDPGAKDRLSCGASPDC